MIWFWLPCGLWSDEPWRPSLRTGTFRGRVLVGLFFFLFVAKLAMDERARVQCVAFECARSVELSRQLCMFVYIFDTLFWTPWQLLPVEERAENRTEPKNMTRTLPCAPYVNTR